MTLQPKVKKALTADSSVIGKEGFCNLIPEKLLHSKNDRKDINKAFRAFSEMSEALQRSQVKHAQGKRGTQRLSR